MCSEDIRSADVCRLKQGMKIGDEVTRRALHGNGGTPAKMIRIKNRSRAIICANAREPGDLRKNSARSRLKLGAPNVSIIPVTGLKNHSRTTGAVTLKKYFASTADLDETGKITSRGELSASLIQL